ncbi:MAG: glucosyltransferase domain-containing protein, partial [Bacteroidales bacterium]|nr:glucosyltransferase domain-containing protein [Bacteroidales bacterium]
MTGQDNNFQQPLLRSGDSSTLSALLSQNIVLIYITAFIILLTYGFMLFNPVIGVDSEVAMFPTNTGITPFDIATGRWGGAFLSQLWRIVPYNPYLAIFSSLCFLGIGALLWRYVFNSAVNGFAAGASTLGSSVRNLSERCSVSAFLFCALYITSPVWNVLMYFHPAIFFFSIMLCPIVILLIFKGILLSRFWLIAGGALLSIFLFSIYQALIPLLCSGVLICFFLLLRRSAIPVIPTLLKILCVFVAAYLLYSALDFIIKFFCDVQSSKYVSSFNNWSRSGFMDSIKHIVRVGYEILIVPFLFRDYNLYGSLMLLPCGLMFILLMLRQVLQKVQQQEQSRAAKYSVRWLYIITGLCVLGSVMLLPVLGANRPPLRTMFSLPLVTGFIVWYIVDVWIGDIERCKADIERCKNVEQYNNIGQCNNIEQR